MSRSSKKSILHLVCLALLPALAGAQEAPGGHLAGLTRERARALAMQHNPELRAAEAQRRAAGGAERQARSHLNPSLEFSKEDFGAQSPLREAAPQETLSLSQPFRTGGKHSAEKDAARWAAQRTQLDFVRQERDLLAEVDRRFARLLGAQERERIAEENVATARQVAEAVAALAQAGEVSPIEALRAENDGDLAGIDLQNARRETADARLELARLLGQREPLFGRAEGALTEEATPPDPATVVDSLAALPDVSRWDAETRRLESSLLLARRSPWPDLTFTVGVRRYTTTGEKAYLAGVALPLPLFDRNRGAVVEASALLDQGRLEREAEEQRLLSAAAAARRALEQAGEETRALRESVLPKAEEVFAALTEGYQRGKFSLLDLLEARRSVAAARMKYVDALVRLNVAKADMDRLTAAEAEPDSGVDP